MKKKYIYMFSFLIIMVELFVAIYFRQPLGFVAVLAAAMMDIYFIFFA